jgi:hypothetical protein
VGPRTGLDDVKKRTIFPQPGHELRPLGKTELIPSPRISDTWCLITNPISVYKFVNHSVAEASVAVYEEEQYLPSRPQTIYHPVPCALEKLS